MNCRAENPCWVGRNFVGRSVVLPTCRQTKMVKKSSLVRCGCANKQGGRPLNNVTVEPGPPPDPSFAPHLTRTSRVGHRRLHSPPPRSPPPSGRLKDPLDPNRYPPHGRRRCSLMVVGLLQPSKSMCASALYIPSVLVSKASNGLNRARRLARPPSPVSNWCFIR